MSRTTQFIGLTKKALDSVMELTDLHQINGMDELKNVTHGMFDEEIALGVWKNEDTGEHFFEFEQASPWSSGPMIFTALYRFKTRQLQSDLRINEIIRHCKHLKNVAIVEPEELHNNGSAQFLRDEFGVTEFGIVEESLWKEVPSNRETVNRVTGEYYV